MFKKFTIAIYSVLLAFNVNAQDFMYSTDTLVTPDFELGGIVIKASKNNSKLKDLPLSATVLSKLTLEQNEINNLNEVSLITPNFVMPDYGSKLTSPVYIRGIGSRINSPSVGLYVDNVPYLEKSAFEFDFFDVETIEVLRGPQGTLYGRNSMGGLINIITKSPMKYQGQNINLSVANYGNYKFNGGFYIKPSDDFAFSLSANYKHSDGFYTNKFNNKKIDELNSFGLNNKIIYKVSDKLMIENIFGMEISDQGGYPYALYDEVTKKASDINYNQKSSYDRKLLSNALKVKYSERNWEIDNTLSYQLIDDKQKIDQDFIQDSVYFIKQTQVQHMLANELIIRSKGNKKYSYLFGAFGFVQMFDKNVDVNVYKAKMWYLKTYKPTVKGIAFFHQSTYRINNQLSVTAGLRYDKEISELEYNYIGKRKEINLPAIDTIYSKLNDDIFLPKIALNYKFSNYSVYASYSSGYKPGGFNTTFEKPEHLMFKNETSHNFEIGFKGTFFRKMFYSDLALFYTKLKDQQIYRAAPSGRGAYLENAGLSENKGFELSVKNRSILGFEGMLSYGYTYSKILEYEKDDLVNYNNNFTPYIPKYTLAVQLNQTFKFRNIPFIDKTIISLLYNHVGAKHWDLDNNFEEKAYGLLNAKIAFVKKNLKFEFWTKNLLNENYNSFLFQANRNTYVQEGKPLQIGVNLSMKF